MSIFSTPVSTAAFDLMRKPPSALRPSSLACHPALRCGAKRLGAPSACVRPARALSVRCRLFRTGKFLTAIAFSALPATEGRIENEHQVFVQRPSEGLQFQRV